MTTERAISTERAIAFADTTIASAEIDAVTAVLRSGWLSADRRTMAFEQAFAEAAGVADAVFVSSGTAALHLAVLALGIRAGDEVIMPSLSFVAAAEVCALHGIVPVFADIVSPDDLTVDPADIERLISPRTRAVVVMHYGGNAAAVARVVALAASYGVAVVEDAAHAHLVETPDGVLGTIGDVGCFSFFATKNMTTGEGGMVLARDPAVAQRVRLARSHGIEGTSRSRMGAGATGYDVAGIGLNYRPTEIAAALGVVQLGRLADDRDRRGRLVARYRNRLAELPGVGVPFAGRTGDSGHHLMAVLLPHGTARDAVRDALRRDGIPTGLHYPPTHRFSYYHFDPDRLRGAAMARERLARTEAVAERLLCLPLHARLSESDVDRVVDALSRALTAAGYRQ